MKLQLLLLGCVALATAQRRVVPQYRVRDEGAETAPAVNPHAPQPANEESGFVHPIDFSGLLRDSVLGSETSGSPFFGVPLSGPRVQTFSAPQNAGPLFGAAHPAATGATFRPSPQHFGSFGAESKEVKEEQGFVQPEMHFGSYFDAGAGVFSVKDFLTAHASSQREVEDRVNAAAEATGKRNREEEKEAGDDGRRRAAATEHAVYHGAEEEEEEAEDEEHPVRTYPSSSRSTPHRSAPAEERGPAQFGHRSSSEPNYGPDYSKAIQEAEEGSAAGVAKGKRCRKIAKKVAPEDVGRGRYRRAANKPAMTCYVCEDPENGGSYESCAYASSPKDKSYFESKSFSSKGKGNKYRQRRYLPEIDSMASATNEQEEESNDEEKGAGSVDDPRMAYEAVSGDSYDENFKRLFPEFNYKPATSSSASVASASALKPDEEEEESASEEEKATDYGYKGPPEAFFLDTAQKKHLEKLVGEFSQKDRTSCKKVMKDKMTCFQCLDEKGMQHEECMFVAKSDPKGRHLAYHELKEYRLVPEDPSDASAATTSLVNSLRVPAPSAAASESKKNVEERPLRPEEVAEADGVYADETSHAFDPVRKIHLPKYMLKKSEHEAIFEEFVKASHETEEE